MSQSVVIRQGDLRDFAIRLFVAAGVSEPEATIVAQSLVESNLCGHDSHGVMRVTEYLEFLKQGSLRPGAELTIEDRTASLVVCDAGLGFGQVQMGRLIELLDPMARDQGIACGTLRACGHIGRLAEWVERVAARRLAAFLSVNDNGVLMRVAPPGGTEPRISTNPLAIGVPMVDTDRSMVLDISTSMVANGKVHVAQLAGRQCPEGWLLDSAGRPTTDPASRFTLPPGTIRPLGGYKGFGLGLLLDMLVGGLSGGCCPPAPPGEPECNNVLMIVFDPARFQGLDHFLSQSQGLADFTRTSRRIDPDQPIRLPHDESRNTRQRRSESGIPLDAGTWKELCGCASRLNVPVP